MPTGRAVVQFRRLAAVSSLLPPRCRLVLPRAASCRLAAVSLPLLLPHRASHLRTANREQRAAGAIALRYLRSWFIVDAVSTIPWQQLLGSMLGGGAYFRAARLLRALRLVRFLKTTPANPLKALEHTGVAVNPAVSLPLACRPPGRMLGPSNLIATPAAAHWLSLAGHGVCGALVGMRLVRAEHIAGACRATSSPARPPGRVCHPDSVCALTLSCVRGCNCSNRLGWIGTVWERAMTTTARLPFHFLLST